MHFCLCIVWRGNAVFSTQYDTVLCNVSSLLQRTSTGDREVQEDPDLPLAERKQSQQTVRMMRKRKSLEKEEAEGRKMTIPRATTVRDPAVGGKQTTERRPMPQLRTLIWTVKKTKGARRKEKEQPRRKKKKRTIKRSLEKELIKIGKKRGMTKRKKEMVAGRVFNRLSF